MKFHMFLLDRLAYMFVYVGVGLLTLAVVQLDLWLSGASLQFSNVLYLLLLGLVGLLLWLYVDYRRQAEFLRHLDAIDQSAPLDQLGLLPRPRSLEHQIFAQAWSTVYARLRAELTDEQQRGRENVRLLSQWAHHMKTPVAIIDLELQKARTRKEPTDVEVILNSVSEENERLRHSLQMLLNQVRLEDFAADFRVGQVELMALVRSIINEQKRAFIAHRVYPKVEETGACTVESDAKWLRFVLEQVVSNALKYASGPHRDGHLLFRCHRQGDEVILSAEDNGIGIAQEDLSRVFMPFFTGTNGREYPQSTGMGLYLAQQACQRLGHRISVESKRGEFTRVLIHFATKNTIFTGLAPTLTER